MKVAQHTFILTWDLDTDDYSIGSMCENMLELRLAVLRYANRRSVLNESSLRVPTFCLYGSISGGDQARDDDRFYIYAVSRKQQIQNRLVCSGFILGNPYFDGRWAEVGKPQAWTVELEIDVMINPMHQLELLMQPTLELQFPDYDWSGKTTDFMLDKETAYLLEKKWYNYLSAVSDRLPDTDFVCLSRYGFKSMYTWQTESGELDMGPAMMYIKHLETEFKIKKMQS